MKFGFRKPSIKKSVKARTTGKVKRAVKKTINPVYGKKGNGIIKDPQKAIYNKAYNKTTFGLGDLFSWFKPKKNENKVIINSYEDYPEESRAFYEYKQKYDPIWNLEYEYREQINNYYSKYINTKETKDFIELYSYCMKYIESLPKFKEAREAESKVIEEPTKPNTYCIAYHKLAMAYEKAEHYESAINVCKDAISKGYTDGTKGGFEARIDRIKKKQTKKID